MAFPTAAQLAARLVEASVLSSVPGDLASLGRIASQVAEDWKRDTGVPLWESTSDSRYYDPDGSVLLLGNYILTVDCVLFNDEALTLGVDYWLEPKNSTPKSWIQFARELSGNPQTIEVQGLWGYATSIPDDVFEAVLSRGVYLYTGIAAGPGGEIVEAQDDKVRIKREGGDSALRPSSLAIYQAAVARYRLPKLF